MVLDHARWLRHADRAADALALWQRAGEAAQRDAPPDELAAFWTERNLLARRLLRDGNAAGAYALAANHGQIAPEQMLDAEFLAGFIALRRLNDPAAATRHFTDARRRCPRRRSPRVARITGWAGPLPPRARIRARTTNAPPPGPPRSTASSPRSRWATMPRHSGAASRRCTIPPYTREQVLAFTDREVVRAAAMLVAWNDPHRARAFLLRMDELAPDPADRALTARLALRLGLPDTAVFVARRMGRDGLVLPEAGWPIAAEPPAEPVDPAVALGLIRQESSFDIGAVSPSGARGLMQLMPFTAQAVAKQVGVATSLVSLTNDPAHNMRLGTAYLQEMLDRFGNSLPLAVAAYNAGPHRVDEWLPENGDPRVGPIDMLDWIELIPDQRDAQLCAARAGECGDLPGAARREHADPAGAMDAIVHRLSAWDGLPLFVREWRDGNARTPLLCLPGLVRTSRRLRRSCADGGRRTACRRARLCRSRPVRPVARRIPICTRGLPARRAGHLRRPASARGDRDRHQLRRPAQHGSRRRASVPVARGRAERYRPRCWPATAPTSFAASSATIRRSPDIDAAVAHLRAVLPPLSLDGDAAWRAMAALTYAPDGDGMLRPIWDTRIARLLNGRTPDLWALFAALAHLPLLLVRGEASDILLPDDRGAHAGGAAGHDSGIAARHRPRADAGRAGRSSPRCARSWTAWGDLGAPDRQRMRLRLCSGCSGHGRLGDGAADRARC